MRQPAAARLLPAAAGLLLPTAAAGALGHDALGLRSAAAAEPSGRAPPAWPAAPPIVRPPPAPGVQWPCDARGAISGAMGLVAGAIFGAVSSSMKPLVLPGGAKPTVVQTVGHVAKSTGLLGLEIGLFLAIFSYLRCRLAEERIGGPPWAQALAAGAVAGGINGLPSRRANVVVAGALMGGAVGAGLTIIEGLSGTPAPPGAPGT